MQLKSSNRPLKIEFTQYQREQIARHRTTAKILKKEIKLKMAAAYDVAKLRSQGLWNAEANRHSLKVLRISEMTPEQRAEYGV